MQRINNYLNYEGSNWLDSAFGENGPFALLAGQLTDSIDRLVRSPDSM